MGFLWPTGPKFITRVQWPWRIEALTHSAFQEKPQTELSTSCSLLLPSESIIREFLVLSFHQWTDSCPVHSEFTITCSFASKLTSQNCSVKTNQNSQYYSELHNSNQSELYKFGNYICIKFNQSGTWVGNFSMEGGLPFVSVESTFCFRKAAFPWFANCWWG